MQQHVRKRCSPHAGATDGRTRRPRHMPAWPRHDARASLLPGHLHVRGITRSRDGKFTRAAQRDWVTNLSLVFHAARLLYKTQVYLRVAYSHILDLAGAPGSCVLPC